MKTNGEFKVERGIPIPEKYKHWRHRYVDALDSMKIGDSVRAPKRTVPNWTISAKRRGIKITVRTLSDTEVRIWRIK